MKVAVQCDSPLLQRSLELFLDGHLSSVRHCDLLVRDKNIIDDRHITFVIGDEPEADLCKPFSKAQLLHALKQKLIDSKPPETFPYRQSEAEPEAAAEEKIGFEILERHIEKLTREYQANIIKAIRAFYEK